MVSEKDPLWKLIFTADKKCKQYYDGKVSERDTVVLSNKTPQCGETVPVTVNTSYLQLINLADRSDYICYEIAGLTKHALNIRPVDRGGFMIFYKHENSTAKGH